MQNSEPCKSIRILPFKTCCLTQEGPKVGLAENRPLKSILKLNLGLLLLLPCSANFFTSSLKARNSF